MANQEVKKTLTVVDRSAKALATVATTVEKVTAELKCIAAISADLTQEIEFKQNELDTLEAAVNVKRRELAADLELRVKENGDAVLQKLLKERNLLSVEPTVVPELMAKLAEATKDNTETLQLTVRDTERTLQAQHANALKLAELGHANAMASMSAQLDSANDRIAFLTQQNLRQEQQIDADRTARVEIAKAEASRQGMTINTSGK